MKQWFIDQSIIHPKRSIMIAIILTALMGSGIQYFVVEDDFMKLLPQDIQSMITWNELRAEFGNTELMFVAFGKRGEDALNSKTLAALWDVTRAMEELEQVDEVMSIASADRMDSDDGFLIVDAMQPYRELDESEVQDIRNYLDDTPKIKTRYLGTQGDYLNVMIRPILGASNDIVVHDLEQIVNEYLGEYDVHWGGQAYLTGALPILIRNDVGKLMQAGLIGMLLILLFSFRNVPAVGMVFITILLSMVFMIGFYGWMYHLTGSDAFLFSVMNTSMPIILLTIANSYGVHIITKFFRQMRKKQRDVRAAVEASLDALILPIFLTALTTIAAFLSMIFAPLEALLGYGVAISAGIVWAWLLTTIFLPSILVLKKWKADSSAVSHASIFERFVIVLGERVMAHPRAVLVSATVVVIIGALGVFKLNVEVNMKHFFKPDNPIRQSLQF
ncbi:MAG: MMPL family transporter, partial [Candidatus Marinimicrobia bacterium]|nr:MMPL family transporter [Candidatus Neomarinimicrobiota bacterium]